MSLFGLPLWYFSQSPRVVIQVWLKSPRFIDVGMRGCGFAIYSFTASRHCLSNIPKTFSKRLSIPPGGGSQRDLCKPLLLLMFVFSVLYVECVSFTAAAWVKAQAKCPLSWTIQLMLNGLNADHLIPLSLSLSSLMSNQGTAGRSRVPMVTW